jgi:bifunctional non-homologous end joining protein LigD
MRKARQAVLELAGREVVITNPDKPFFPQAGHTKLHLVRYYAGTANLVERAGLAPTHRGE